MRTPTSPKPSGTVLAALLLLASFGCAQAPKFQGRVIGVTGAPVAGVEVSAETETSIAEEQKHARLSARTDANGQFILREALADRDYAIRIAEAGWLSMPLQARSPARGQTRIVDDLVVLPYRGEQGVFLLGGESGSVPLPLAEWRYGGIISGAVDLPVAKSRPIVILTALDRQVTPDERLLTASGTPGIYRVSSAKITQPQRKQFILPGRQISCWIYPEETPAGVYGLVPFLAGGSVFLFRAAGRTPEEDRDLAAREADAEKSARTLADSLTRVEAKRRKAEEMLQSEREAEMHYWGFVREGTPVPWEGVVQNQKGRAKTVRIEVTTLYADKSGKISFLRCCSGSLSSPKRVGADLVFGVFDVSNSTMPQRIKLRRLADRELEYSEIDDLGRPGTTGVLRPAS